MYHHISWPDAGTSATTCDLRPLPCWISIANFVLFEVLNMMELFELFIISFPNSRWTLWEAKQTKDIVSNKACKQSIFRCTHQAGLLVMIFVYSWVSFISINYSLLQSCRIYKLFFACRLWSNKFQHMQHRRAMLPPRFLLWKGARHMCTSLPNSREAEGIAYEERWTVEIQWKL